MIFTNKVSALPAERIPLEVDPPALGGPRPPSETAPYLLSVEEAADRLRVGRTTMFALIRDNQIATIQIGRRRLITTQALQEFVTRLGGAK